MTPAGSPRRSVEPRSPPAATRSEGAADRAAASWRGAESAAAADALIYRGEGTTVVLRESGEFWTVLETGKGRDLAIVMVG